MLVGAFQWLALIDC